VPYIGQDLQVAFPSYTNIDDISGSFDGVTTSFPLTVGGVAPVPAPLGSNQCLISVDGVVQRPDDTGTEGFRLSGGNIIFSSAPSIADDFFGIILAGADYVNVGANFPDGTLAAPSITFDQDNDTGYYRSGSGSVSFASNGVAAGTWSSAGVTAPAFIPTSSSVPTNGVYLPAANSVGVATNGTGKLFVDSTGKVSILSSQDTFFSGAQFRIGDSGSDVGIQLAQSSANAGAPRLVPTKSRGTLASPTAVLANDQLFTIRAAGYVGSAGGYVQGSQISMFTDGTPTDASNGLGSYVTISTRAVGGTLDERLRITSAGLVGIGTTSPGALLDLGTSTPILRFSDTDTSGHHQIQASNTNFIINADPTNADANSAISFNIDGSERARIDSSGRLLVGTSTSRGALFNATGNDAPLQVEGTTSQTSSISIIRNTNNSTAPFLVLGKSRGTAVGGTTVVNSGDSVGTLSFQGSDDTELVEAARITAQVDGTPGADDMPGRLVFSTTADGASSPTERMRISSTGTLTLNTGGAAPSSTINGVQLRNTSSGSNIFSSGTTTTAWNQIVFVNGNGTVGTIQTSASATSYNTSSDYRLKENVVNLDGAIDRLKLLPVHRFNFIADPDTVVDGFIAHEAAEVVPECVTGTKDEVDDDGNPVYQGIDQSKLVPLLTAALQEAIAKIETLEAAVTALQQS
jgi:hypothetical protein